MRKSLFPFVWFFSTILFSEVLQPESSGVEIQASAGAGWASYEEKVSIVPVNSSWDAPTGTIRLQGALTRWAVDLYGELRLTASATETESWEDNGIPVQQNDLTYTGTVTRFGVRFPLADSEEKGIFPRLGGFVALDEYDRENFFFLRDGGTLFTLDQDVTETVFTVGPSAGISAWFRFGDRFTLDLDTEFAWAVYSDAENTGFDVEIEGDGGWKWSTQVAVLVDLTKENQAMGVSVRYDLQEVDGDTLTQGDAVFEWPDNTLEQIAVELFWMTRF
jgi:hypothetical protein